MAGVFAHGHQVTACIAQCAMYRCVDWPLCVDLNQHPSHAPWFSTIGAPWFICRVVEVRHPMMPPGRNPYSTCRHHTAAAKTTPAARSGAGLGGTTWTGCLAPLGCRWWATCCRWCSQTSIAPPLPGLTSTAGLSGAALVLCCSPMTPIQFADGISITHTNGVDV
jgi:hypothetical protein